MCRLKSQICPPPSDDSGDDEGEKNAGDVNLII